MVKNIASDGELLATLRSSSTLQRIVALRGLRELIKSDGTFPLYNDRESRREVENCLHAAFERSSRFLKLATEIIGKLSKQRSLAASSLFVLLEWSCIALEQCACHERLWNELGQELIRTSARLLEMLQSSQPRHSISQSALVRIRRALRSIFKSENVGPGNVFAIVQDLSSKGSLGWNAIPLLGIIAGVSQRLSSQTSGAISANGELVKAKPLYYDVWIREVLNAKTQVPAHISRGFGDFWSFYVSQEDLKGLLVLPLEKAILRAPEVVLNDVLQQMLKTFPQELDLSDIVSEHLLKPILSSFKSTNVSIRSGALHTLIALLERCKDTQTISKEISDPLFKTKSLSVDQRTLYAEILATVSLSPKASETFCKDMAALASKEQNESALAAETATLVVHTESLIKNNSSITEEVLRVFSKGLDEKKVSVQRIWIICCGSLLWQCLKKDRSNEQTRVVIELTIPKFLRAFKETEANAIQAAQGGLILFAYILVALSASLSTFSDVPSVIELGKLQILKRGLSVDSRPSFLLNPKVYSKLVPVEEKTWFIRALAVFGGELSSLSSTSSASEAWVHSYLWLISSRQVEHSIQKAAMKDLSMIYEQNPSNISCQVIRGLWSWFWMIEDRQKDTAAALSQAGMSKVHLILKCISPQHSSLVTESPHDTQNGTSFPTFSSDVATQMINLLVLCQDSIIPRSRWIDICLRSGLDPGQLASHRSSECIDHINRILAQNDDRDQPSDRLFIAANDTFAELAFVDPEGTTPRLAEQIDFNLQASELSVYTPTDFAIAKTPEGTTFIDVLSTQSNGLDKAAADYDTQRWERELREQIAAKKGQQRKLTPDEKAKVNSQLEKEAVIRQNVRMVAKRLKRGIGAINGLVRGPPTDAKLWLGTSLLALSEVIKAGGGLLLGDEAESTYVSCSKFVSLRLGQYRESIGVATVRALGSVHLPANLMEEPLEHLITRTLYRLRLSSEQRPFDPVSLNYILPFLSTILERSGYGSEDEDTINEQVTLALEFLSFHGEILADTKLPRARVLSNIIYSLQKFSQHYRLAKDILNDVCHAVGSNASSTEISTLVKGIIVPQTNVRNAVLQAIRDFMDLTTIDFSAEVWLACHDDNEDNAAIAEAIWHENALELSSDDYKQILPFLDSSDKQIRRAAARSLAQSIRLGQAHFQQIMNILQDTYLNRNKPIVPQKDKYGLVKKSDLRDPWEGRDGIALAFRELSSFFSASTLAGFLRFLIDSGPLGDRNATVRDEMLTSAVEIIAAKGADGLEKLMDMFEMTLNTSDKSSSQSDLVNEATIILYGSLARHLKTGDERVPKVVDRLLQTLSTPSETVQYAVASCLPPLVRTSLKHVTSYVQQLLEELLQGKSYATRRGAAYGLAGVIDGKGILALKEYRIMTALKTATEDKKATSKRQAVMMAYELLSLILGRKFEPYVIQVVPQFIVSFGDVNADVRDACLDASKTCFSTLSSYGVKIILPILLQGLDEDQWRSKRGACDLLGAMAYLDPQQLASSLPQIIPPLTNVLNDTHKEVRAAANRSLQRFGEVISNPEVKSLVQILLKALSDPTKYTDEALDSLIRINFVHYLDAPSLALVVRILDRGLGDRSATKRKAAQIIGSLAHLTDRKDLTTHLPMLVAGLRAAAVDPVPTTRATASKALGSLMEKLGEDVLPDLIPSLMSTLKADTGAGDRLGSAQALSEVLAGLGTSRLEATLPTILQNVSSSKPSVREGFMSLFIFLPACFGNSFASYLNKIIPPILGGLADDVESIRDTALRAGRLIVKNFATKAIDLLLPELDRGLADSNYRIRLSSVELVGDLLFSLTGISAKQEAEDDDSGAAEAGQSLLEVLGEERRNKVLSSLFICRNDTSGLVRSAAINVWKALVASPRTLKELVPTLTHLLIKRLASVDMEHKVIAGNSLGELIRKSGEGVLSTLLPSLEDGLQTSTDADERQGICIALREVISSSSPEILENYEKVLISVVRSALVDPEHDVRETAAEAFDSLQQIFGKRAVDQVLPYLLSLLRKEDEADTALGALLTLLTDNTRSNFILPNLMPTLIISPISAFNARAIASLSQVSGEAFVRRIPNVLNALMDNIIASQDEFLRTELRHAFDEVLINVDEFDGLNTAMSVMLTMSRHDDHHRRAEAATRLSNFFEKSTVDYSRYNQDLMRVLLLSFDDRDIGVVKAAWTALTHLVERLKKEEMESLVPSTRQIVQQVGVAGSDLAGFCLPKGIGAILKLFTQGLMNGSIEQRIQAALALSDVIDRTSVDGLKPFVTNITGPLIRVVSEKSTELRSAILFTLNNLLEKVPLFLKPFLPQLQRTFAKSLSDTTSEILRNRAAKALGTLLNLKPRVDPLIAELVTGARTPDEGVRTAMLKALFEVVNKAGETMSETSRNSILGLIDGDTTSDSDSAITTNSRLLGTLVRVLPGEIANPLIKQRALTSKYSLSSILSLNAVLLEAPNTLLDNFPQETPAVISHGISHKSMPIAENAVLAAGKYLLKGGNALTFEHVRPVMESLSAAVAPGSPAGVRRLGLITIRTVARHHSELVRPHLTHLVPSVFGGVRDITIPVKLAAEAAFIAIFSVVDHESAIFDKYIESAELNPQQKRGMQDYFKRVATRLAGQARERAEAEGGQGGLGLSNDELEDEREILSIGRVELTDAFSND